MNHLSRRFVEVARERSDFPPKPLVYDRVHHDAIPQDPTAPIAQTLLFTVVPTVNGIGKHKRRRRLVLPRPALPRGATTFWKLRGIPFQGRVRRPSVPRGKLDCSRQEARDEDGWEKGRLRPCHCSREFFDDQKQTPSRGISSLRSRRLETNGESERSNGLPPSPPRCQARGRRYNLTRYRD